MSLWVFGYGSLMWRPGFRHREVVRARLHGFKRCFCIYSVHHRGNEARPGLVLGLDRGGSCEGIAYRVADADVASTMAYLRAREQVNGVYREARVAIELGENLEVDRRGGVRERVGAKHASGSQVSAVTYLVERAHPSYAARLPLAKQAQFIRGASGLSGNNIEYLANTLAHLDVLGIRERELERLAVLVFGMARWERIGVLEDCPRLKGLTRATARRPISFVRLRKDQRRRFGHRKFLS